MYLYVGSMQYAVSLLFPSLCYFLITRLPFFNILFTFVFLLFIFVFSFMYSVFLYCFMFCVVLCTVSHSVLSVSYFCTSLPTAATGWKPNYSK
jgi:hypothetical protein